MMNEFWNEKIEAKPLNELKNLQLKRLRKLIHYIYNSNKFYHKKLRNTNLKPEDIKTLNDIQKLPFLTKQDLRKFYPFGLVCTKIDNIVEVHAS